MHIKLLKITHTFSVVTLAFAVAAMSIIGGFVPKASAADTDERLGGICTTSSPNNSGFGLYQGNFEAYSNGDPATFHASPTGYTHDLKSFEVIPDSQTDVGNGPGETRTITTSYSDSAWFLDGRYEPGYPAIQVHVFDDADDIDEHHSTIHFAVNCTNQSGASARYDLCSVVDIRIHYEGEDAPSEKTGFNDSCAGEPNESITANNSGSQSSGTSGKGSKSPAANAGSAQSTSPSQGDIAQLGVDAPLNELADYVSGNGAVLWLKPAEGAIFKIHPKDKETHSLRVKSLGDNEVTIVVASDPIEFTLKKDQSRKVDVDKDGTNDIEVTMLGITDGQAGVKVKPLTKAAATAVVVSKPKANTTNNAWRMAGIILIVVGFLAVAGIYLYRHFRKTPKTTKQNTKGKAAGRQTITKKISIFRRK